MSNASDHRGEINWPAVQEDLMATGYSHLENILTAEECLDLIDHYDDESLYRSKVVMSRHNFGKGEYQYYTYPLPNRIETLRNFFYGKLSPFANLWATALKTGRTYPLSLRDYLEDCHSALQLKPTPLILKYGQGDYNCLHQDIYGAETFPLQVAICLSESGEDFTGGEFVLTHQRPRMQSVVEVVPLKKGDAVIFAVNERPETGKRGVYRIKMRHGVSKVRSGNRYVLGLIFHDAT